MMLSKEDKKKLKKLNTAKYNPIKGIDKALFVLNKENNEEMPPTLGYKLALNDEQLKSCMQMFEDNMTDLYQQSSWGLNLVEKREELLHSDARYLIVTTKEKIIGFCHFRFDVNDDDEPTEPVVYVYELQVVSAYQRYGIGRRLMEIIHLIAKQAELSKVMLTVFHNNRSAAKFYEKLGYRADETSPNTLGIEEDYDILSRSNIKST